MSGTGHKKYEQNCNEKTSWINVKKPGTKCYHRYSYD